MTETDLLPGERLDDLQLNGLKIIQNPTGYCFTSDAVLLANFVKTKQKDVCLEIGTGSGAVSILVNEKQQPKKIFAFEIQKSLSDLTKRNVLLNGLQEKIEVFNLPIQSYRAVLTCESVDVVFANPPWQKGGSGKQNESEEIAMACHEKTLTLQELAKVSFDLLRFGGRFFVVYPAARTAVLIFELKKNKLEPKKLVFVHPTAKKAASVVLLEAVKGGKEGMAVLQRITLPRRLRDTPSSELAD